jgi:hypothetical protein
MTKALLVAIALVGQLGVADADGRPRIHRGKRFEANKTFGLGVELGGPSGLNGKWFLAPSHALDFGVGTYLDYYYGGTGFNLYADYLWHPVSLVSAEAFELPFYVGVGGRFISFDSNCGPRGTVCDGADAIGVRVPIGVAFDFNNLPLDVFGQVVPTFDFFHDYNHDFFVDVDVSVGIRYWFL